MKTSTLLLASAGLALMLGGCNPIVNLRGNFAVDQRLAEIKPGTSTRDEVRATLGAPTATGTLDPNTWYYIGRVTEQTAFFKPEVTAQKIVRVRFDENDVVQAMDDIDGKEARYVEPVDRATPTAGRELTFLEQLIGNLNRSPKKKDDKKKR